MPIPAGTGQGRPFPKTLFNILIDLGDEGGPFSWKMGELSLFTDHTLPYNRKPSDIYQEATRAHELSVFNIPKSHLLVDSGSRPSEIGQYTVYSV